MEKPSFIQFLLNNVTCSSAQKDDLMKCAFCFAARAKRLLLLYYFSILHLNNRFEYSYPMICMTKQVSCTYASSYSLYPENSRIYAK